MALSENVSHYNEYFQKENIFYNQIWNKIKEGFVIMAQNVIKFDKANPTFEDYMLLI